MIKNRNAFTKYHQQIIIALLICFQLKQSHSQQCFRFLPLISGGTDGDTKYSVMDADSNYNLVIGGSSSDSSIALQNGNPDAFVIFFNKPDIVSWLKTFDSIYDDVTSIAFFSSSYIAVALDTVGNIKPQVIAILYQNNGSIFRSYNLNNQYIQINSEGMKCDSSRIYLAYTTQYQNFNFLRFPINNPPIQTEYFRSFSGLGNGNSILISSSTSYCYQRYYISGKFIQNGQGQSTLIVLDQNFNHQSQFSFQGEYTINKLDFYKQYYYDSYYSQGYYNYISFCGENDSDIIIGTISLDSSCNIQTNSNYYIKKIPQFLKCIQIKQSYSNELYFAFQKQNYLIIGWLQYQNQQKQYKFIRAAQLDISLENQFVHGKYYSNNDFFIIGQINQLGQLYNYSPKVGFMILTSYQGDIQVNTQNLIYDSAYYFVDMSPTISYVKETTSSTTNIQIFDGQITVTDKLNIAPQIQKQYVITSTLQNISYIVESGSQSYSFNQFQIDSTCSDLVISYQNASILPTFVSFSPRTFQFNTNDAIHVNNYTIKVNATINNGQWIVSEFVLNVYSTCPNGVITPSTIPNYTYAVTYSNTSNTFPAFTTNVSYCQILYKIMNIDGSDLDESSIVRQYQNTNQFYIYTNDEAKVGEQNYLIRAFFRNYNTTYALKNLTIIVKSNCTLDQFTTYSISEQYYYWNLNNLQTLYLFNWTQSKASYCPPILYNATYYSNNSVLDSNIFQMSENSLAIQTSFSNQDIRIRIKIIGTTFFEEEIYKQTYISFYLTITNNCQNSVITSQQISSPINYYIGDPQQTFQFDDWTSDIPGCGPFYYSATYYTNSSSLKTPLSFTSDNRTFQISQTTNLSLAAEYILYLRGALTTSNKGQTVSFKINFINPCTISNITSIQTVESLIIYYVAQPSQTFIFAIFATDVSSNINCGIWNYQITGPQGGPLDTIFQKDLANKIIYYGSNDPSKAGQTYTIEIKAYQGIYSSRYYILTFDVNVVLDCSLQISTIPANSTQIYQIKQSLKSINPGTFTYTISTDYCPIQYECYYLTNNTQCSDIFSINQITGQISVYSNTPGKGDLYQLVVRGHYIVDSVDYYTDAVQIDVTVLEACELTMTTQFQSLYSYEIFSTQMVIEYVNFTFPSFCGQVTYEARFSSTTGPIISSSQTSNVVIFNSSASRFQIFSDNNSQGGYSYDIFLIGILRNTSDVILDTVYQNFKLQVTKACLVYELYPAEVFNDIIYRINEAQKTIEIKDFIQKDNCNIEVLYILSIDHYETLPQFIKSTYLETNPKNFTIYTKNSSFATYSPYQVRVTAELVNLNNVKISYTPSFRLIIEKPNTGPPKFMPSLKNIMLKVGEEYQLTINDPVDQDGDNWIINSIKFSPLPSFLSGDYPTFTIKPEDLGHIGEYKCSIVVADLNRLPLSATYQFIIKIQASSNNSESTNSSILIPNYDSPSNIKNQTKTISKSSSSFTASIKSTSIQGVVIVYFSSKIIIPPNYKEINDEVMLLTVRDNQGNIDKNIVFTWEIQDFTSEGMIIQLNFEDSSQVSKNNKNSVNIEFIQNGYFIEESTKIAIKQKTIIQKNLPKQMRQDSATAALINSGGQGTSALGSLMYGSMALNIIMAASLSLLWGMINVLQIIINMPLMNVEFPMNVIYFYQLLMDMANFDILPSTEVQTNMFEFDETPVPDNFAQMDIFLNIKTIYLTLIFNLIYDINLVMLQKILGACLFI